MPPARLPHLRAGLGIFQDSGDRPAQFRRLSRWDEQPGLLVHDDFLDAPDPGGHDRRLAGHRLEVDDPERLVDGGQANTAPSLYRFTRSWASSMARIQTTSFRDLMAGRRVASIFRGSGLHLAR